MTEARETIRNQVMRFADPADMDVGNWDICTDNILTALRDAGFAVVKIDPYMQSLTSPMRPVLDNLLDGLLPVLHEFTPNRSGMIVSKVADAFRSALKAAQGGTDE